MPLLICPKCNAEYIPSDALIAVGKRELKNGNPGLMRSLIHCRNCDTLLEANTKYDPQPNLVERLGPVIVSIAALIIMITMGLLLGWVLSYIRTK
jgi:hypothetical protein